MRGPAAAPFLELGLEVWLIKGALGQLRVRERSGGGAGAGRACSRTARKHAQLVWMLVCTARVALLLLQHAPDECAGMPFVGAMGGRGLRHAIVGACKFEPIKQANKQGKANGCGYTATRTHWPPCVEVLGACIAIVRLLRPRACRACPLSRPACLLLSAARGVAGPLLPIGQRDGHVVRACLLLLLHAAHVGRRRGPALRFQFCPLLLLRGKDGGAAHARRMCAELVLDATAALQHDCQVYSSRPHLLLLHGGPLTHGLGLLH